MSATTQRAFRHIGNEYGGSAGFGRAAPVGPGVPGPAGGGAGTLPQWTDAGERFSAARAYDKLLGLVILAVISAAVGYVAVPSGVAFACMAVAFGLVLLSWFRMRWARVIAPAYSVLEGVALGSVSAVYASVGHHIVPVAIVFTGAVFFAALALYRTGMVRVTPRMVAMAFMGGIGLVVVGALSLLGLSLPGLNSFGPLGIVFGVVILAIAVLNLFTDFAFVTQAETLGLPADAEWAAAFAMMTALVLVYISILRIIASAYGGGRRT